MYNFSLGLFDFQFSVFVYRLTSSNVESCRKKWHFCLCFSFSYDVINYTRYVESLQKFFIMICYCYYFHFIFVSFRRYESTHSWLKYFLGRNSYILEVGVHTYFLRLRNYEGTCKRGGRLPPFLISCDETYTRIQR